MEVSMLAGMSSTLVKTGKSNATRTRALLGVVATLALLAGCGTGSTTTSTQGFLFIAIGPEGGTATAGPVKVIIPPGALPQPTGVAILPQATPLPIQSTDGCNYSYVGPIFCCGPVGHPLLVNGVLRMGYDEGLIPLGFTESDLVLLEWNNAGGFMEPRAMPPAFQDTANNFFEDPAYDELGHVAIGLRECNNRDVLFDLLVQDGGLNPDKLGTGFAQGRDSEFSILWGVDSGASAVPAVVPTGGLLFNGFVPSPDLTRVLLATHDPQQQGSTLHTILVDGTGTPALIAASDFGNNLFLQSFDPTWGWLQGAPGQVYFTLFHGSSQEASVVETLPRYEIFRRPGDALAGPTQHHQSSALFWYLDDTRQSASGGHFMSFWQSFNEPPSHVDVTQVPADTIASLGVVPNSQGPQTPRFFPGSSDLYMVNTNGQEVNRHTAPGGFVDELFSIFAVTNQLYDRVVDFAMAPDGDAFAAIVEIDDNKSESTESLLLMGTLSQGVLAFYNFFEQVNVQEMVWHPLQTGVFLDLGNFDVGLFKLNSDDGFYITQAPLPVFSMRNVDVNRIDGRIAILVQSFSLETDFEALPPGIYVSPGDASDFQPVATPGIALPRLVRWLATWRHCVGFASRVR
jgi:hypothetical protein